MVDLSHLFSFFRLVYAWGTGTKGELGTGVLETQLDPVVLEGLKGKNIVQVSCGEYHSIAVSGLGSFDLISLNVSFDLFYDSKFFVQKNKAMSMFGVVVVKVNSATERSLFCLYILKLRILYSHSLVTERPV